MKKASSEMRQLDEYQDIHLVEPQAENSLENLIFHPKKTSGDDLKRYTLVIPQDVFDEVQRLAEDRQTTVVDLFRRFIRLGLLAMYLQEKPDAGLIIKDGDVQQRLLML